MARFEQALEDYQYKDYVTQSLQLIPQNAHLIRTFAEVSGRVPIVEENGDEIAESVITGAGLTFEV